MLLFSVVLVVLAIASFQLVRVFNDDVMQVATLLISLLLLLLALIVAPWFVQLPVLVIVLLMLNHLQRQVTA